MMNVNEPGALVKSEQERFNVLREMSDYVGQLFSGRRKLPSGICSTRLNNRLAV
jgi:hypothetical protein